MTGGGLHDVVSDTLTFELIDYGDTFTEVDAIFDAVVKTLQHDSRFTRLSNFEFDLLFADIKRAAENALRQYQKIDWEDAANVVTQAVIEHIAERNQQQEATKQSNKQSHSASQPKREQTP